jgi:hypothetical protein
MENNSSEPDEHGRLADKITQEFPNSLPAINVQPVQISVEEE